MCRLRFQVYDNGFRESLFTFHWLGHRCYSQRCSGSGCLCDGGVEYPQVHATLIPLQKPFAVNHPGGFGLDWLVIHRVAGM